MVYAKNDNYELRFGKMQDELKELPDNSIDSIVTDPPYELNFMNKGWDNSGVAFQKETWEECLRVLKPGGYMLAFGGSRTFHRIACAIEDAGFEIRDTIMWLYGSGFPKSMNIGLAIDKKNGVDSKVVGEGKSGVSSRAFQSLEQTTAGEYQIKEAQNEWNGWGSCLKPAYEPIIMARKPLDGTIVDNIEKYGVGGINIDECRVELEDDYQLKFTNRNSRDNECVFGLNSCGFDNTKNSTASANPNGRFPANIITDGSEEVAEGFPYSKGASSQNNYSNGHIYRGQSLQESSSSLSGFRDWYNDEGSAMRYFYCAKASKKDRDEGLDGFIERKVTDGCIRGNSDTGRAFGCNSVPRKNTHPTVKPASLMQYLIRLISPKGATVLDPFMGSGSTGKAAMLENSEHNTNYKFIGVEMTDEYLPIAKARIEFGMNYTPDFNEEIEEKKIAESKDDGKKRKNIFQ